MYEMHKYNHHLLAKLSNMIFIFFSLGLAISSYLYNALLRVNFMRQMHGYNHHLSAKLFVFMCYLFLTFLIGPKILAHLYNTIHNFI